LPSPFFRIISKISSAMSCSTPNRSASSSVLGASMER
jgi:hypothetical protein